MKVHIICGLFYPELHPRAFGYDVGGSGLAHSGRPVEYHIGDIPAFDYAPQIAPLPEKVALTHNVIYGRRAYTVS